MEWFSFAGALLIALLGWLGGLSAARRGSDLAFKHARELQAAENDRHQQQLRASLNAELRLNIAVLEARHANERSFGGLERTAWRNAATLAFTDLQRERLFRSYTLGS